MNETTGGDEVGDDKKRDLLLPPDKCGEGYVLECWKVKEGTLVRTGETVALACLASAKKKSDTTSDTSTDAASPPVKSAHKRPARRKRTAGAPGALPNPASSVPKGSGELKSITLFPTADPAAKGKKTEGASAADDKGNSVTTTDTNATKQTQSIPIVAPTTGFVCYSSSPDDSSTKGIGFIELCKHPTVVGTLCGVCGMPMKGKSQNSIAVPASPSVGDPKPCAPKTTTQVTVAGGLTFTVSEQESIQIGKQNAQRLKQLKKLSLVLDLDHTLVHATADNRAGKHLDEREDVRSLVLSMSEDAQPGHNMWMQHYVKLRPNVKEFLETVMPMYEIGVYTAGTRQYAEQIATVLCRHLVGQKCDQVHLDRLRYEVPRAQARLKWEEQIQTKQVENRAEATQQKKEDDGDDQTGDDDAPPSKKRKVMFTADTKEGKEKSAQDTLEDSSAVDAQKTYATLKAELEEAERLEKETIEMRKRVFGSRIVSRSDVGDLGRDVKSLKRIFPCGGTMAAVVDDREDVWANAKDNNTNPEDKASSRRGEPPENLLLVKPYHWQPFVGFADINNASGVDLSEKFDDQSATTKSATESDVQLLWTADVLKRLHSRYYSQDKDGSTTVPEILQTMRKEVLQGFKIVLSGLVPLHKQSETDNSANPRPAVVRYAESLGAFVLPTVQSDTAFVIAARDGTDKILQARKVLGCSVVKVSWLMECFWTMTQRDPRQHVLSSAGRDKSRNMANGNAAKPTGDSKESDDDDDDDDDFAAEFEEDFM